MQHTNLPHIRNVAGSFRRNPTSDDVKKVTPGSLLDVRSEKRATVTQSDDEYKRGTTDMPQIIKNLRDGICTERELNEAKACYRQQKR